MWGIERMKGHRRGQHGLRLGRVVVHVIGNGSGAPLVDDAWLMTEDGRRFGGKCLSLVRRRDSYGDRLDGCALFFGWRQRTARAVATATLGPGMEPSG